MNLNLDNYGLIITPWGDGGDTSHSEGVFWTANKLLNCNQVKHDFDTILSLLQVEPGVYCRHPIQYPDPKDFSRDQTTSLVVAMGLWEENDRLKLLLKKQFQNFFRFQNGDLGTFEDLNNYIRALKLWYLFPLLFIGDIFSIVSTLIHCFWVTRRANNFFWWLNDKLGWWWLVSNAPPNTYGQLQEVRGPECTSNDLNRTLTLLLAQNRLSTPLSALSRFIYKTFRPKGVQYAWSSYYRNNNRFDTMMEPLISKYFT